MQAMVHHLTATNPVNAGGHSKSSCHECLPYDFSRKTVREVSCVFIRTCKRGIRTHSHRWQQIELGRLGHIQIQVEKYWERTSELTVISH